ncbi:Protein N-acetyltransferase, RimJ/RimL family [Haladaptatus litoreus]|uniref:Protein N-acetyltransferase, RimJ/RimL family n=1 Tax=Haladaptatus litoreus TaxID=553468 RepID=A0A1N6XIH6_9EURY|nr:GNAT family protein [Haladaptatus litoreus]SIR02049.1 Protein N-acetyltransferase, RimJ/RimL family [Haladaptatus litoreus]
MPGPVFCSSERVELRTTEREDIDLLQQARSDPELRTSLMFILPQTREQVEEFYENTVSVSNGDSNFIVCVDGEPIGEASLFDIERDHGTIAYWLDADYRGNGYATEAVSLLLDYAFDTRGLHRVVAKIGDFNDGSQALIERLGFTQEGRLRDHLFSQGKYRDVFFYGLLRDEWTSNSDD